MNHAMNKILEEQIRTYFQNVPNINAAFVYGSIAAGNEQSHSDIDIALLLTGERLDFKGRSHIIHDLMQLLDRDIDLVSLKEVSSVLQVQILKKGKLLFCKDKSQLTRFQVKAVREYLDLKKIRKPIEEQLKNVSIYG